MVGITLRCWLKMNSPGIFRLVTGNNLVNVTPYKPCCHGARVVVTLQSATRVQG